MWRFLEEGPLLKFPLRESPFMSADPMRKDYTLAPPLRFQFSKQNQNSHPSFFSSSHSEVNISSKNSLNNDYSSSTIGLPSIDEIPKSIKKNSTFNVI